MRAKLGNPTVWEYHTVSTLGGPIETHGTLHDLGVAGWEMTGVVRIESDLGTLSEWLYYFKRPRRV